jgi:uncharacterized membrane protein
MTVLIVANGAFGIVMLAQGAWPVAGFLGLDVLAVYVAFRASYAQTAAFERITIAEDSVIVAQSDDKGRAQEWRCPSYWANVSLDEDADERGVLTIGSHGRRIALGRFLHPGERTSLARDLRNALGRARQATARS